MYEKGEIIVEINVLDLVEQFKLLTQNLWVYAFLGMVVLDFITGYVRAFITGVADSSIGMKGLVKHAYVVCLVLIIYPFLSLIGHSVMADSIITFYILNYGLSVYENTVAIGIPLPTGLISKEKLNKLKKK
jgi:toxin secretion/phage lysis holin